MPGMWLFMLLPIAVFTVFTVVILVVVFGVSVDSLFSLGTGSASLTCFHCGAETPANSKTCSQCGEELQ